MIIEYLTQQNTLAGDERHFFVVNKAVPEVPLNPPGIPGTLRNGAGLQWFQPDDHARLLSIGLGLPYSFTISTRNPRVRMFWADFLGAGGAIVELTGTGNPAIELPWDGAEFPLDVAIQYKSPGQRVCFSALSAVGADTTSVSMSNAPGLLNGLTLRAWFFVKVVHTLPMV